ncbi:MAG: hypothetical protein ACRDTT_09525, partial [Pseudonocardiaceae bacterium]
MVLPAAVGADQADDLARVGDQPDAVEDQDVVQLGRELAGLGDDVVKDADSLQQRGNVPVHEDNALWGAGDRDLVAAVLEGQGKAARRAGCAGGAGTGDERQHAKQGPNVDPKSARHGQSPRRAVMRYWVRT